MRRNLRYSLGFLALLFCFSCGNDAPIATNADGIAPLFTELSAAQSGIDFENRLTESDAMNYFTFEYIYNGGGVAVLDVDGDGLDDVFFTGNQVGNRLYRNLGNLKFEDITDKAGVKGSGWQTGVSVTDINLDGAPDIFVCRSGYRNSDFPLTNQLFVNDGKGNFTEQAAKYGFTDAANSIQGSWFDYDQDGDIDIYITSHPYFEKTELNKRLALRRQPPEFARDKLYQNNGNGTFTEVGRQAGIINYGHGLGVVTADLNDDGLTDVYVTNDYNEPDFLYVNNGDGTFTDKIKEMTGHVAFYAMGLDVADINNDGLEDIMSTEMLPGDYKRSKTNMAPMNQRLFEGLLKLGLHHQYMKNTLQLNNGDGEYSDIAQLAGVAKTDWSWACLLEDLDLDGKRDLFVANGYRRDVFDNDSKEKINAAATENNNKLSLEQYHALMPSSRLRNFLFENTDGLHFTDRSEEWGLQTLTHSNGAALSDLDNDGDLDLLVNNLDQSALLLRNNAEQLGRQHLSVRLEGPTSNPSGLNADVRLRNGEEKQVFEMKQTRGFLSSLPAVAHFGLGERTTAEEVSVTWPDGKVTTRRNVPAGGVTLRYADAQAGPVATVPTPAFEDISTTAIRPAFVHRENEFADFKNQILLPHRQSHNGPFTAVGDVNGDGREDFYVGGAHQQAGALYVQGAGGQFTVLNNPAFSQDAVHEDMGVAFVDADADGDLDLYVASGGTEFEAKHPYYQDRLYLNDGRGRFTRKSDGVSKTFASASCVVPADYDGDGDVDLFVGGRVFPEHYPYPTQSYLMQNQGNGRFVDVAYPGMQALALPGMVTAAAWDDLDADGDPDLLLTGEWMALRVFENDGGNLVEATDKYGLTETVGWWNSLTPADLDGDGDTDFVAGNLGLNHKFRASPEKPFYVYANDFDQNGSVDVVLAKYNKQELVPVRGRECSSQQMPFVAQKFPTFNAFADADLTDIYGEALNNSYRYAATTFESVALYNDGGRFRVEALPVAAQVAPIMGSVVLDTPGGPQLVAAGNLYQTEAETTRADAGSGVLLERVNGAWRAVPATESGLRLRGDVKSVSAITVDGREGLLVTQNNGPLRLLRLAR